MLPSVATNRFESLIDLGVHAAYKEARNGRDAIDGLSPGHAGLDAIDVRVDYPLVRLNREEQRNVDIDTIGDELANCLRALFRTWNLDQKIGTVDCRPETVRFFDRRCCIIRDTWRHLDGYKSVLALGAVVHVRENIARVAHILRLDELEQLVGVEAGAERNWASYAVPSASAF